MFKYQQKRDCRRAYRFALAMIAFLAAFACQYSFAASATNIILLIGDGMGFEHIKAGRCYKGTNLCFESWTNGSVCTLNAYGALTDSGAGGTAIATGRKVDNGVISMAIPGDGSDLQTLLEYFKGKGKRGGLVTTDIMTGATPATFGAHAANRSFASVITSNYLHRSHPNVLFGGSDIANDLSTNYATDAGYMVVTNLAQMTNLNTETATMVSGQFGNGQNLNVLLAKLLRLRAS